MNSYDTRVCLWWWGGGDNSFYTNCAEQNHFTVNMYASILVDHLISPYPRSSNLLEVSGTYVARTHGRTTSFFLHRFFNVNSFSV